MLLEQLKADGQLFNVNFLEETSTSGLYAYRGELVLVDGEVGDSKGHTKPPKEVIRAAVVLADEKIKMFAGHIDDVASLPVLLEKYQSMFADDMLALIYIVNLAKPLQVDVNGVNFVLIPLVQGVTWNEMMEEVRLEKSDFKGQTPGDKLVTMFDEMKSYKPKYDTASLDEAVAAIDPDVKREVWGAV